MVIKDHRVPSLARRILGHSCRVVCFDLPLLLVLSAYAIIVHTEWVGRNYIVPLIELQQFDHPEQSLTYYHRVCSENDQTTDNTADLLVDITTTNVHHQNNYTDNTATTGVTSHQSKIDRAVQAMYYHGITIVPNLISVPTATKLRDYIMEQNTNTKRPDFIDVIENDFRYSFGIQVDEHPIIADALEEILDCNPDLVTYLEAVMGSDPAVTEFTAISQMYGAVDQRWHEDVVASGSSAKYGRSFVPTYNLFIPLQNVTAEMGATWICPGTHICSESSFCDDTGFQASGHANNWPLGSGIFMNQQLTHRGGGHRDPDGPQRVVLILTFAPRPRVFNPNKVVETRKIGLGGSYSQHVSQWGHTLSDYQHPNKRMKQPYRMLRSLGVYNIRLDGRWGWDYITVCTGNLANDGYTCPSVQNVHRKLERAKLASSKLYQMCMMTYIVYMLLSLFISRARHCHFSRQIWRHAFRLTAIHLLIFCASLLVRRNIKDSTWGRNIQAKRSFRLSNHSFSLATSSPATLPEDRDVMIFEGVQSETDSHVQVLQVAHPGNRNWNALVRHFAQGYDRLLPTLQAQIRRQMLDILRQQSRRILIQNNHLNWAEASHEVRHRLSHKILLQISNRNLNNLIQSFGYLLSETRHGYWRDTVLYKAHIVQLLTHLQRHFVPEEKSRRYSVDVMKRRSSSIAAALSHVVLPRKRNARPLHSASQCGSIPCYLSPTKPTTSLNVGDVAEATFVAGDDLARYRCTISSASSDQDVWDILLDDGRVKKNLCHTCVRTFDPYVVNETIDVLLGPDGYTPCQVVAIHQQRASSCMTNLLYDVQLYDSNITLLRVATKDLRRNERSVLTRIPIHTHIMVRVKYQDDASNFTNYDSGEIIQYDLSSNSYNVLFDDGEVMYNVSRRHIHLIQP